MCAGLPSRDNIVREEGGMGSRGTFNTDYHGRNHRSAPLWNEAVDVVSKEQAMWMETMRFTGFRFS